MRILFEMILDTQEHINVMNQIIVNRTTRIKGMADNVAVFRGKAGDEEDDGSLSYVLFS